LDGLCRNILEARANAVFYITDADLVEYQTAAVSYFLQIADFIGLPVIMWTADMTGLPSVCHNNNIITNNNNNEVPPNGGGHGHVTIFF